MFGLSAGRLDTRATFSRRRVVSIRERGEFAPLMTVWAQVQRATGREQLQAGQEVAFEPVTLRIRSSPAARGITAADRVTIAGCNHRITSVSLPLRSGLIEIAATTDLGER